jgi:hypothetical protein
MATRVRLTGQVTNGDAAVAQMPVALLLADGRRRRRATLADPPEQEGAFDFGLLPPGAAIALVAGDGRRPAARLHCQTPRTGRLHVQFTLPEAIDAGAAPRAGQADFDRPLCLTCAPAALRARIEPDEARDPANRLPGRGWQRHEVAGVRIDFVADPRARHGLPAALLEPALPGMLADVGEPDLVPLDPASDAPAYVQRLALAAARAIRVFCGRCGLRHPAPDAPLRVRLWRFREAGVRGATDAAWDHVRLSTQLAPDEAIGTLAHEIFHRVQYQYNDTRDGIDALRTMVREGGAVLAEDVFDDRPNRYIQRLAVLQAAPWVSAVAAPPGDPFGRQMAYTAALFWRWLEEQFGRPRRGAGPGLAVMRQVLELTATRDAAGAPLPPLPDGTARGYTIPLLRAAIPVSYPFAGFAPMQGGGTGSTESVWANFLAACALLSDVVKGERRWRFREQREPTIGLDRASRMLAKTMTFFTPTLNGDEVIARIGIRTLLPPGPPLQRWAQRHVLIQVEEAGILHVAVDGADDRALFLAQLLHLRAFFSTGGAQMPDPRRITTRGTGLVDAPRAEGPRTRFRLAVSEGDWLRLVLGPVNAVPATITVALKPPGPLLMITPWNCRAGTRHEQDPRDGWNFISPDIGLLHPPPVLLDRRRQKLRVTVRNEGQRAATGIAVAAEAALFAAEPEWRPVQDSAGRRVLGTLDRLEAKAAAAVLLPWRPHVRVLPGDWMIRARIVRGTGRDPTLRPAIGLLAGRDQAWPP